MSDVQLLKDVIDEHRKSNKKLDDILIKIEQDTEKVRQEQTAK